MNYYELQVKFDRREGALWTTDELLPFPDKTEENEKKFYKTLCNEINELLSMDSDRENAIYAYYATEGVVKFIYEANLDEIKSGKIKKEILDSFKDKCGQVDLTVSKAKEITCESYFKKGKHAEKYDYIYRFNDDDIDIFENSRRPYVVKETMLPEKEYDREQLLVEATEILADDSFINELERIYSSDNEKKYFGNPVHYMITVTNRDSVDTIVSLLGKALLSNKRILGRRITRVSEIEEGCYDEDEFEAMISRGAGNLVVIELDGSYEDHGNYANAYHRVIDYIDKLFRKYQRNTLCVFVKNQEHPGFADILIGKITDKGRIVEIKEGGGNAEQTLNYIKRLADKEGQPVDESDLRNAIGNRKYYKVGEAHEIYNKCFSNALMYKIYKAYKTCSYLKPDDRKKHSEPYEELQKMIGLTEIKKVVDSIINNAKIQKLRSDKGMDTFKTSMHMVFTGNPGSAKTTVARLLGQILAKENVIDKADIVECGRSDLVGQYVGWTAHEVKSRFRQAQGGILFIDEAYSLVDDSHSFGDEAINTIVQEMENRRDDVIVIFAGYPDKMKEFLDKNEGLRSRIAFHLDFPDYNANELVQIMQLMASQKGMTLETDAIDRCKKIFESAVNHKDYGNGRFVRNLLEQAMLAQSSRLSNGHKGKNISRKALTSLVSEDFDVNACDQYSEKKMKIGFSA
ncbi:MAG: AAA family ATPase [Clostridiales bacterium]|nr:AAA family ATPase [Clostridiales bacterium]